MLRNEIDLDSVIFCNSKFLRKSFVFNDPLSNLQNMTIKFFDFGWRILRFIITGDRTFEISAESI